MSESWRGFRFQTGEIKDIVANINKNGFSQVDVDNIKEIELVTNDLKEHKIKILDKKWDTNALNLDENPEFYARVFYNANDKEIYIDFFLQEEEEESYDEIFWG